MSRTALTDGPVLVIGTGLIGTSIALALQAAGVPVLLDDPSPTSLTLAAELSGGQPLADAAQAGDIAPQVVLIAAPPDVAGQLVARALADYPSAVVTDVASVKESVLTTASSLADPTDLPRYVGAHPMAGKAQSGAAYAARDLFYGQMWVVAPGPLASPAAVRAVRNLGVDLGAIPLDLTPAEHDQAVAYVSHVPQVVSSLLAARLLDAPARALELAGGGLRDTTRIAASDPRLWMPIIAGNAPAVARVLDALNEDLAEVVARLERLASGQGGAIGVINEVMTAGNQGVSRIPGKHGGANRVWADLEVLVPDRPGQLAKLFGDLGEAQINIEDFGLEHSAGARFGRATLQVDPAVALRAADELEQCGWRLVSGGENQ